MEQNTFGISFASLRNHFIGSHGGATMTFAPSVFSAENQFVEVPLILDRDQIVRLEMLAMQRGQTVGSLVRDLIRTCLARANDQGNCLFKSSA